MKEILKLGVCINDLSISAPEIVFTVWATNTCEHEVQRFLGQQWKFIQEEQEAQNLTIFVSRTICLVILKC